jgi:hypothetical protein
MGIVEDSEGICARLGTGSISATDTASVDEEMVQPTATLQGEADMGE